MKIALWTAFVVLLLFNAPVLIDIALSLMTLYSAYIVLAVIGGVFILLGHWIYFNVADLFQRLKQTKHRQLCPSCNTKIAKTAIECPTCGHQLH